MSKKKTEDVELTEQEWLDNINQEAQEKAEELGVLMGCIVEPAVFVVEPLKDAAIAFIKKPDAKQAIKILRQLGTDWEGGLEIAARAQLVRDSDVVARGQQGTASDSRFLDANGVSAPENSDLNVSLMLKMRHVVKPFSDEYKKK